MRRLAVASLVLATLAGCGTARVYDGPKQPASELARIDGDPALNAGLPIAALIRKVDDKTIGVGYSHALVAPGKHLVLVDCLVKASHVTTRFELTLEASAGERYVLVPESAPGNQNCADVHIHTR